MSARKSGPAAAHRRGALFQARTNARTYALKDSKRPPSTPTLDETNTIQQTASATDEHIIHTAVRISEHNSRLLLLKGDASGYPRQREARI